MPLQRRENFASAPHRSHLEFPPPVQFPSKEYHVKGVRISALMGSSRKVSGIDLGLVGNTTDQDFHGLALAGVFNWNKDDVEIYGAQIAGLVNYNEGVGKVFGIQAALIGNFSSFTDVYGVQLALINKARNVYGLQLGLVNFASSLHGVQIGLANFNESGMFGVSPLINFGW